MIHSDGSRFTGASANWSAEESAAWEEHLPMTLKQFYLKGKKNI